MRLIDADALYREYERAAWYKNADRDEIAEELLLEMPTIDPASLRPKGRWITTVYTTTSKRHRVISNVKYTCSECGYGNGRKRSNYCPRCGSDMSGKPR